MPQLRCPTEQPGARIGGDWVPAKSGKTFAAINPATEEIIGHAPEATDTDVVITALERNKKFLRGEVARRVNLKFAPDIRFRVDERFDEAERIEKLLQTPAVQRDLASDQDKKP